MPSRDLLPSERPVQLLDQDGKRVESAELEAAGQRWADRITSQAPLAIRLTKALFHASRDAHPLVDDIAQAVLFETDDKRERMTRRWWSSRPTRPPQRRPTSASRRA